MKTVFQLSPQLLQLVAEILQKLPYKEVAMVLDQLKLLKPVEVKEAEEVSK